MRIRKLLPAFVMAAALTLTIPVSVYAAEDDNQTIQSQTVDIEVDENGWRIYDKQDYFEYELYQDDDGVTKAAITGLLVPDNRVGLTHCVYIPDTIDDYVVGRIEAKAFYEDAAMKKLSLPGGLTSIGDSAFYNCQQLKEIEFPDKLKTIESHAFERCRTLTTLEFPDSVRTIGDAAFDYCDFVTSITFHEGLEYIGSKAFNQCQHVENEVIVPPSVTSIRPDSFPQYHENVILHIPYSLASNYQESDYVSRNQVYAYNPIKNESGDTCLEVYLLNSNLKDFTFPESFWGVPVTRIAEGACNKKFTGSAIHVTIPECITEIGEYAFAHCDSELTLAWPANITKIPDHTFDTSYGLEEIQIPDTVTSIGTRAFYSCTRLTSIHLPDSLTEIKESAFESCSRISDITLPDSLQYIGDNAFNGALMDINLKIPSTVKEIGKRAFYRSVTPSYGGYLSLIVEPGSYAYDYAKKNALSMDLGETTILYTTCMNGDHDWRVIIDKEPTCTEDGQSHEQCYDCEIIKEDSDKVLPAKGHNWGYEYIRQATCTEDGYKSYECTNKGCTATKNDTLPATGHEWVLSCTIQYCEETGFNRYECSKCDAWEDKYDVPATGHKLEEYTEYESDSHKGTRYIYCVNCNYSRTEDAPESSHVFTPWMTDSQATVFSPEIQSRSCDICGLTETRKYGKKITATMSVNVTAITLNTGQSSSRLKVTGFQTGDSVRTWTSGNSRIVKVSGKSNGTCVLTAGKVTGKTIITITMKSGIKKTVTITVKKPVVKTRKITKVPTKISLKRGKSYLLKPVLTPSNSTEKKTYTSGNKKVATVSAAGKIIAKGKGTTTITVRSGNISARCKVTVK